ncbi:MAG: thymidine phosphorylase [Clostridia bacterium]|nr:thymidine phosphorylase [Clostridia bacterium]
MHIYDIITKKKHGEELTDSEIEFFIKEYTAGNIPDYQASALLMAVCLKGCTDNETATLTQAICDSGDVVDLSLLGDGTVDKHSTGGVGDKTTLIVAPIVASLGAKVAKMSGRGLGHTGGTVDKLESFPGYKTSLSPEDFLKQVKRIGIAVIGQSGNLAPADKKLYALRDVTATVDSIPLITSSIMGKKLAAGSQSIVLDVKYGSGSFMKSAEASEALARCMVDIGYKRGRRVSALITNMDVPLGHAVGNILEVKEAIEVLSGKGPTDLREVALSLATEMTKLSLGKEALTARRMCEDAISSGKALKKLVEWIGEQGGDSSLALDTSKFPSAPCKREVLADRDGYITAMNTEAIGLASVSLGAGRVTKDDVIDFTAGIIIEKKTGDAVRAGDVLATLYSSSEERLDEGERVYLSALTLGDDRPEELPLIHNVISK